MGATAKGTLLGAVGAGVDFSLALAVLRPLLDWPWGKATAIGAGAAIAAALFGFAVGRKDVYAWTPRALWAFVLDISWSALNTATGLVWMIYCRAKGSYAGPDPDAKKRGIVRFKGGALPGADATTFGTVIGGDWSLHEAVHVQQARIFGPFYWPLYLASYATNLLVRAASGRTHDLHWEAYGRVVLEDWAYRAAPDAKVKIFQSILWGLIAGFNLFALAIVFANVPVFGALPQAIGLAALPWWLGLVVILVYSVGRSFMPMGHDRLAEVVFT
jgi:hypothetical protein